MPEGHTEESGNREARELDPTHFLDNAISTGTKDEVALIILNTPLHDFGYFNYLYQHASFVVCADGGANRLHDLLISKFVDQAWDVALKGFLPHAIHGDLDSINSNVRDAYASLGVDITEDPDQYSTDFGKAVNKILKTRPNISQILVLGSLGGRVDQGIGLLHELYREQCSRHPGIQFWLFSEASISTILQQGSTVLRTSLGKQIIGRNIGILPIYGPATISTTGLEWDVKEWKTEMGGKLSTSNHIVMDAIEVATDREVLFTVERYGAF